MTSNPDLDPHKAAVVAMSLWGQRYSRQNLGSMGFWKSLTDSERRICREIVERIGEARQESAAEARRDG